MNTLTKSMSSSEISALYSKLKPLARSESQPAWTLWQLKTSDMTVTAYTSGKVVFQGKDVSWLADEADSESSAPSSKQTVKSSLRSSSSSASKTASKPAGSNNSSRAHTFPMAGSDEVGTGDYFGPIAVAAVIVENQETANKLKALKITDSKAMTDAVIRKVAPQVAALVPHAIEILNNTSYNKVWNRETMNINRIKALMHNRAYLDLLKEHGLPENRIVDQFCKPDIYYRHVRSRRPENQIVKDLHFETKAEGKYIAVAAASVLARNAFLQAWDEMEKKYDFHFEKGAGAAVDRCGRKMLKERPDIELTDVAKVHFANTEKIKHG